MAGTLLLLYALQSIFGNVPQPIFVVAWVILALKIFVYLIEHTTIRKEERSDEK